VRDEDFDEEYVHLRKVKWLKEVDRSVYSQQTRYSIGSFSSVSLGSPQVYEETVALLEGRKPKKDDQTDEEETEEQDPLLNLEELLKERLDEFLEERFGKTVGHPYAHVVAALLRAMGYVTDVAPPGPDQMRDIMAYPDELRMKDPLIRAEVKSSTSSIGVQEVQTLCGALRGNERGLYVARGGFTR